ncbi:MAG: hypothetical protein GX083_04885 [Clostridiales bacterium]|nr:hypothetical protein [Clostridiales bacterium]
MELSIVLIACSLLSTGLILLNRFRRRKTE